MKWLKKPSLLLRLKKPHQKHYFIVNFSIFLVSIFLPLCNPKKKGVVVHLKDIFWEKINGPIVVIFQGKNGLKRNHSCHILREKKLNNLSHVNHKFKHAIQIWQVPKTWLQNEFWPEKKALQREYNNSKYWAVTHTLIPNSSQNFMWKSCLPWWCEVSLYCKTQLFIINPRSKRDLYMILMS
jgi:hypothetical protein